MTKQMTRQNKWQAKQTWTKQNKWQTVEQSNAIQSKFKEKKSTIHVYTRHVKMAKLDFEVRQIKTATKVFPPCIFSCPWLRQVNVPFLCWNWIFSFKLNLNHGQHYNQHEWLILLLSDCWMHAAGNSGASSQKYAASHQIKPSNKAIKQINDRLLDAFHRLLANIVIITECHGLHCIVLCHQPS